MIQMEWHDAILDPPDKEGKYLVCYVLDTIQLCICYDIQEYSLDLYKVDKYDFYNRKGKAGWYNRDSEWGYYESNDVLYWMELPEAPDELKQYK